MKFFTKKESNLVFTVKENSNTDDLIFVGDTVQDAVEAIKEKGLEWINQIGDNFALVLIQDDYSDARISRNVDICHVDNLSEECDEVLS